MTDLVGRFHVQNCLNYAIELPVPEVKVVSLKKFWPEISA